MNDDAEGLELVTIPITLADLLRGVPEKEIRAALQYRQYYDQKVRYTPHYIQSQYAPPKYPLWGASCIKAQSLGRRFTRINTRMVADKRPNAVSPFRREFYFEDVNPDKLNDREKHSWTFNDQDWAWREYVRGAAPEELCLFVGGRKEDFIAWVKAVCRGEEEPHVIVDGFHREWTSRMDRMLWLMYQSRIDFRMAYRMLGVTAQQLRERISHLKKTHEV